MTVQNIKIYNYQLRVQPREQFVLNSKMIIGSQSISNESQNFNDYRYQKALKQISKLINVNRQIKIQSEKYKCEIQQVHSRNEQILEVNAKLENQLQNLRNQVRNLKFSYVELQNFCKTVEIQQKYFVENKQKQTKNQIQIQYAHKQQIQTLTARFDEQISHLVEQMRQKDLIINELEQKAQFVCQLQAQNNKLHEEYELTLGQNQKLNHKIQDLNCQLATVSTKMKEQSNEDLTNKLRISEQWIKSLNQQNYSLKQKFLQQEYKKERQKYNQSIFQNMHNFKSIMNIPSGNASEIIFKEYTKQIQKKIKKIEEEKKRLQNKSLRLKQKCASLQIKAKQIERENNLMTIKLSGYQQLTERQQAQIQNMIKEFNKQMDFILKNNAKDQNQSNSKIPQASSPTRASNKQRQLKLLIESLQTEIQQNRSQAQEKDKLIQFLEMKIQALEEEQTQLQRTNQDIEQELSSFRNTDLSKTSKVASKVENLLKTQPLSKNGAKVFMINGRKYESQLLRQQDSCQSEQKPMNTKGNKKATHYDNLQLNEGQRKISFPSGQISYIASERKYGSSNSINNTQRA